MSTQDTHTIINGSKAQGVHYWSMAYVVFADGYGSTCCTADWTFPAHRYFVLAGAADGDIYRPAENPAGQSRSYGA